MTEQSGVQNVPAISRSLSCCVSLPDAAHTPEAAEAEAPSVCVNAQSLLLGGNCVSAYRWSAVATARVASALLLLTRHAQA